MKAIAKRPGHRTSAGIGIALTFLAALPFLTRLGDGLVHLSYELPFAFRPQVKLTNVVILYMDDQSHINLGQPFLAEWDRSLHATAVDRLGQLGASAIVFDILFQKPTSPANDALLVAAAQRHGKVFFSAAVEAQSPDGLPIGKISVPFTNVFRWGIAEISGAEKFVRQHYRDAADNPSLAWVVAQATMAQPPTDVQKDRWLNYYGPPGFLPHRSYYELFSNGIPATVISNKVVFVGAKYGILFTGGRGTDDYSTPFTRWNKTRSPGVEVVATSYLNLWRSDWLTRMSTGLQVLVLLGCGVLFGGGFALCHPIRAALFTVVAFFALSFLAIWLMWKQGVWFAWLIPATVQLPIALAWSLLAQTKRMREQNEALEIQLAAANLTPASPRALQATVHSANGTRIVPNAGLPLVPDHTLIRKIGSGAYGDVWIAKDIIGTYHAVKVVYQNRFSDTQPFNREFHGVEKFTPISRSHAGFIHILHVGRNNDDGYFYCIMELGDDQNTGQKIDPASYVPRNLSAELERRGTLPPQECVEIGLVLCSGLDHLHRQQLLHRDIKPANIIFVNDTPKFADVGLVTEFSSLTEGISLVGTPDYMPPEGPGLPAGDLYALGRVLYVAFTGLHAKRFPELPTDLVNKSRDTPIIFMLNRIIVKACEQDVTKRYQSAAEMHAELLELHNQLVQKE